MAYPLTSIALFLLVCAAGAPAYGAGDEGSHTPMNEAASATGIFAPKEGSGTAWQPAASPMYAHSFSAARWALMFHYNAFLTYNHQQGPRGDDQWGSTNWAMLAGSRPLGEGRLTLRGMLSLERATTGGDGYPLLFQTGETWNDEPLVDRQHPHDFFMELAARYDHRVGSDLNGYLYLAPVGEPALGPVAYPHRASAIDFPLAPLGHHWQDSSHITYGVLTAGVNSERWKAELSAFNGREPDEERWDLDPVRIDSWSGRITHNWNERWSASASWGLLNEPEPLHPNVDLERKGVAAMYARPMGSLERIDATAIWGRNTAEGRHLDSYLLEGSYSHDRHHFFVRWENVAKTGEELLLAPADETHRITTETLGYVYDFYRGKEVVGAGISLTAYTPASALRDAYGYDLWSGLIYLRVRPAGMVHAH